jgi:hypothetical protein
MSFEKPLKEILAELKPGGGIKILDPDECISDRQNGWLHCKNGPIRLLMKRNKMSFIEAKVYLKTEFGWSWFVKGVDRDNYLQATGALYWYCHKSFCEKRAFHLLDAGTEGGMRQCPGCGSQGIQLIAIQSINKKSVSTIKLWFDEIIKHFAKDLLPPNPDFNKTLI